MLFMTLGKSTVIYEWVKTANWILAKLNQGSTLS